MIGQIGVPNGGANLQTALRRCFNLIEGQTVYVENVTRGFDIEFHEVQQGCAAGDESDGHRDGAGTRRRGRPRYVAAALGGGGDGGCSVRWSNEVKSFHETS